MKLGSVRKYILQAKSNENTLPIYHPTLEKRNVRYLMDSEIDLCCIIRLADKMIATRFCFPRKT